MSRELTNQEKLNLTTFDLYDRIINLKFKVGKEVKDANGNPAFIKYDEYILRSDYEVVYPDLDVTKAFKSGNIPTKRCYIRKCQMKPSIKVQYQNVGNTAINIDIFISNFFMVDSKGQKLLNFNDKDYPLKQVEIMLGYWGQFKRPITPTLTELFNFDIAPLGVEKITMNVLYVSTDKLPPDSLLHIHGCIGANPYNTAVSETIDTTFDPISASENNLIATNSDGVQTALEKLFFQHITRRFVKNAVTDKILVSTNGFMSAADAKLYGIQVYCSKGVKELSKNSIEKKVKDASGNEVDRELYFNSGTTAENTLANILTLVTTKILKKPLVNGDWLVFTEEEAKDIEHLKAQFNQNYSLTGPLTLFYKNILPAVYNINVDALTTIVAPFFFFVNSFDYVQFESRYSISSLVPYLTSIGGNKFFITKQSISFATVENINEMTLVCVAGKEKEGGAK